MAVGFANPPHGAFASGRPQGLGTGGPVAGSAGEVLRQTMPCPRPQELGDTLVPQAWNDDPHTIYVAVPRWWWTRPYAGSSSFALVTAPVALAE